MIDPKQGPPPALPDELRRLQAAFEENGGRGVDLADRIDELNALFARGHDVEYMTVTLVVEYEPAKTRTPDDWDWGTLVGGTAIVLNAWGSEIDELQRTFDAVCVKCVKPIVGDEPVYATADGAAAGPPVGEPYHVGCLGPQPEGDS